MEFKRKFGRKKGSRPTKGIVLIVLLVFAILLWYKAEDIMNALLPQ